MVCVMFGTVTFQWLPIYSKGLKIHALQYKSTNSKKVDVYVVSVYYCFTIMSGGVIILVVTC